MESTKVGGIIMDINDGSIIAMDEMPSFDPNNYKMLQIFLCIIMI